MEITLKLLFNAFLKMNRTEILVRVQKQQNYIQTRFNLIKTRNFNKCLNSTSANNVKIIKTDI